MLPRIKWILEDAAALAAITLFVMAILEWAAIAEALLRD